MNLYDFLVNALNTFLSIFPPQIQWLVTLLVLVGLIGAFVALVRHNALWLILIVVLVPFLVPVLAKLVGGALPVLSLSCAFPRHQCAKRLML